MLTSRATLYRERKEEDDRGGHSGRSLLLVAAEDVPCRFHPMIVHNAEVLEGGAARIEQPYMFVFNYGITISNTFSIGVEAEDAFFRVRSVLGRGTRSWSVRAVASYVGSLEERLSE